MKTKEPTSKGINGLHHYQIEDDDGKTRVHLRLDKDGSGTLIVNANQILHLIRPQLEWLISLWKTHLKPMP